jgi:hypothetical protein
MHQRRVVALAVAALIGGILIAAGARTGESNHLRAAGSESGDADRRATTTADAADATVTDAAGNQDADAAADRHAGAADRHAGHTAAVDAARRPAGLLWPGAALCAVLRGLAAPLADRRGRSRVYGQQSGRRSMLQFR